MLYFWFMCFLTQIIEIMNETSEYLTIVHIYSAASPYMWMRKNVFLPYIRKRKKLERMKSHKFGLIQSLYKTNI